MARAAATPIRAKGPVDGEEVHEGMLTQNLNHEQMLYVHVYIYIYIYICVYVCVYIYIYIYIMFYHIISCYSIVWY